MECGPAARTWEVAVKLLPFLLFSFAAGCAHVAPYDRGALAHPTMTPVDETPASVEHVRAVQEGAIGGGAGAGGGCGCN